MKEKPGSTMSPRFRSHHSPNYMKSTTSADARREQSKVSKTIPQTSHENSSFQKEKRHNEFPDSSKNAVAVAAKSRNVQAERATCSSTLKDCRSPDYLKPHPKSEGTSDVKVCRYHYCSFNGHLHSLSPPLKSFVSERRRALKAKGNVNVTCQLPKANPHNGAEIRGRDIEQIGEIDSKGKELKSDERFGWLFDEISGDGVSQESFDEERVSWDLESLCSNKGSSLRGNRTTSKFPKSGGDATVSYNAMDGENPNLKDKYEDATTEIRNTSQASSSIEEMATFVHNNQYKTTKHDDQVHNQTENSTEGLKGERNSKNTKTPDSDDKGVTVKSNESTNQKFDDPRSFNPREPHLLHIEPEPGAEEVNLRHQELEERKKPEEWMVDYALRQEVKRGGSRRRVALLVQAFERVVPKTKL